MINLLDYLYSQIDYKNQFLRKIRFYSAINKLLIVISNLVLPLYLSLGVGKYKLNKESNSEIVVTLTTFSKRINKVWLVIELMMRQTYRPKKIVLCLLASEYPNIQSLPTRLQKQIERGLEVIFSPIDLKVHLKYFWAMQEYPLDLVVLLDDDVFYRTDLLESLFNTHKQYPTCVCCNAGPEVQVDKDMPLPYENWKEWQKPLEPSRKILPLGVGGVLYPPNSLGDKVFFVDDFMKAVPKQDDLWLYSMAMMANTKIVKSALASRFLPIVSHQKIETLHAFNNLGGGNNLQIRQLREYLLNRYEFDYLNLE